MTARTCDWMDYALKGDRRTSTRTGAARAPLRDGRERLARRDRSSRCARDASTQLLPAAGAGRDGGPLTAGPPAPRRAPPTASIRSRRTRCRRIGGRLCCGDAAPARARRPAAQRGRGPTCSSSRRRPSPGHRSHAARPLWSFSPPRRLVDTDFTAMLADVEPCGYARFLTDGIVRARYRDSTTKAEPSSPAGRTSTTSTSGPRATCSRRGTASGSTCRAATSRASTAT